MPLRKEPVLQLNWVGEGGGKKQRGESMVPDGGTLKLFTRFTVKTYVKKRE